MFIPSCILSVKIQIITTNLYRKECIKMDKNQKTAQESPILGKQSVSLKKPVYIIESASVVGKKEGEGPLGELFDLVGEDDMFGGQTWEDAESTLQKEALGTALGKAGWKAEEVRYLFAGDLLGQEIATSFGLVSFEIPLFGLYGACSTCGLSLTLASLVISGGFTEKAACVTSSHFASAEKEFRFPLGYGNQRPLSATWTVTGSGAFVLAASKNGKARAKITGLTSGKIVDYGLKDSMNMGGLHGPCRGFHYRTAPEGFRKAAGLLRQDHYRGSGNGRADRAARSPE